MYNSGDSIYQSYHNKGCDQENDEVQTANDWDEDGDSHENIKEKDCENWDNNNESKEMDDWDDNHEDKENDDWDDNESDGKGPNQQIYQ